MMRYQLNVLANVILNTYFNQSGCLLIFNNKLNSLNYFGRLPRVIFDINRNINPDLIFRHYGCQGFVITSDRPVTIFNKLEAAMKLTGDRFNFRQYLFLPVEKPRENVSGIFGTAVINYVSNVLTVDWDRTKGILDTEEMVFSLSTHKYVGRNGMNGIVLLDKWFSRNESFLHGNFLYPEKLEDQQGRDFKIATFTYMPYSVADPPDGTEVLIAFEYARKHNMTPQLVIDEKEEWGVIYDNWTGVGILGNVVMDKGDVGLGALYTWEHDYHFLDLSKPISRTGITCIAPAPTLIGGWITPFIAFNREMWLASGISFVLCALSIFTVLAYDGKHLKKSIRETSAHEKFKKSFLMTEAMFLLQSVSTVPIDLKARVVYGSTFLLCLLLGTLYACGLASNMTVSRYQGVIRTPQDLADANILWGATSPVWISSIVEDTQQTYKSLVNSFIYLPGEDLIRFNDEKFAFSVERLPGGNFAIGNYITKKGAQARRLMNEDIYWEYCVIMTRKSSILLPSINAMILRMTQTGIFAYWEFQVMTRHLDTKIQKIVKYSSHVSRTSEPVRLQWKHVEGAFGIWFIGMGLSFLSFLTEMYLRKRKVIIIKKLSPSYRLKFIPNTT